MECGDCLVNPPPFRHTVAAVDYAPPWAALITRFKFHGALDLTTTLTGLVRAAQTRSGAPPAAWVLPVPLSDARLRERGFNQAWELARRLALPAGCRADPRLLLRVRDSPHQLALAPDRRAINVHGVFAVEPRRRAELRGRAVAVVDDVMTTGATGAEIARVLLQAGAAQVDLWVVARTPRPPDR